jgi:hypothetical protein
MGGSFACPHEHNKNNPDRPVSLAVSQTRDIVFLAVIPGRRDGIEPGISGFRVQP